MTTYFHEHLSYKLTVFRQSHIISFLICLILSYFLYLENQAQWLNSMLMIIAAMGYLVVLALSFFPVDKEPLYLVGCWITLFLMGYFLTSFPLADSPALPWLCILPSLLIFFLNGRALLMSSVVVVGYLILLIYPVMFMPETQTLASPQHTLMLIVSSSCAVGYAFFISFALWNSNNKQKKFLFEQNSKDPLTGAYNRRAFEDRVERRRQPAKGYSTGFGVVMVDIDNFKTINDTYGHTVGDSVLKMVTESIRESLRKQDMLARYGGEEFVLLFENINQDDLLIINTRILQNVRDNDLYHKGTRIGVTISGGCVYQRNDPDATVQQALELADKKLYEAKHQGKDRILYMAM